jgi:Ca-activated chloride channel homolog
MTTTAFSLSAAFDRSLFWQHGGSVRYLVVRLNAQQETARQRAERPALNIALAIDASGSMAGEKLQAAKRAALGLLARLTDRDRLSVVSFASDVIVHLDGIACGPDNHERIAREINRLATRGMTNLSGGWMSAVECAAVIAEADPKMTARVIILSDGQANEGITNPGELAEHASELRTRGVLTSALGIGDGYDEMLLRGMAEAGGGRLHDAELASEIETVLLGEIEDIYETAVERVELALTVPPGVQVSLLGKGEGDLRDGRLRFQLGPVQHNVERTAVFRVTCPKAQPGEELAFVVSASGVSAQDGAALAADAPAALLRAAVGAVNNAQPRDLALVPLVARAWLAHVVARVAAMNRVRAHREAGRMIAAELKHFRRYVGDLPEGVAMVEQLELLAQRAERELSPRISKELMLSASLMMESREDRRGAGKESWAARIRRGE